MSEKMRGWKIKDGGNYLSKEVNDYEVTIERKADFYHVSIWRGETKDLIEEQDIQGVNGESEMRAIKLGDQLVKQLRGKKGSHEQVSMECFKKRRNS